jgi:hypothetical protein
MSAHTAEKIISIVTVTTESRTMAMAIVLAVVSDALAIRLARGVFDKSHNRPAGSAHRLVIEAVYPL